MGRPRINKVETMQENMAIETAEGTIPTAGMDPVVKKARKPRRTKGVDVNELIAEFQIKKQKLVDRYQKKLLKAMYK